MRARVAWSFALAAITLAACGGCLGFGKPPDPITVTVRATGNCELDPTTIMVQVNQRVTMQFQNLSQEAHSFFIDELAVKVENVQPGMTATAVFTPTVVRTYTESGAYIFYCDAPRDRKSVV